MVLPLGVPPETVASLSPVLLSFPETEERERIHPMWPTTDYNIRSIPCATYSQLQIPNLFRARYRRRPARLHRRFPIVVYETSAAEWARTLAEMRSQSARFVTSGYQLVGTFI